MLIVPMPPGMMPSLTSVSAKRAVFEAYIKSQLRASSVSTTISNTVYRRDHWNGTGSHGIATLFKDGMLLLPLLVRHAVALFQVATCTERPFAATGYNHTADILRIDIERFKNLFALKAHLRVDGVEHLWTIQCEEQNVIVDTF